MQPKFGLLVHKLYNRPVSNLHLYDPQRSSSGQVITCPKSRLTRSLTLVAISFRQTTKLRMKKEKKKNGTSTPSEDAADAEAEAEGLMSESRVRKRKSARPKNPRAMRNSNAMNQFRCQIGNSDSEGLNDSLYTIRVDPGVFEAEADEEEEEEGFLRDKPWEPEEATVLPPDLLILSRSERIHRQHSSRYVNWDWRLFT